MDITLQYFDGCPNWKITDSHLKTLIDECGLDATVNHQLIDTSEAAEANRFRGSPTVLIDGTDPLGNQDSPVGLSCRVYVTGDESAGSPTLEQLKQAIAAGRAGAL